MANNEEEDLNRRSSAYQRQRREFEKTSSSIRSTGEAMKVLSKAVDDYSSAVKRGDAISKDVYERGIRQIRDNYPRAWKKLSDESLKYKDVAAKVFMEQKSGLALMEDRIGRISAGMRKYLNLTKEQASTSISGMVGRGTAYQTEQELLSLKEDFKWRRALKNEGKDTSAIDERIGNRVAVMREKSLASGKKTIAQTLQMQAVAEKSSSGLTKALASDSGAFGALAAKATDSSTIVGSALRSVLKQETLAAAGVSTGGAAGVVGGGASMVIGTLAKALGPLSASLTGASLFGRILIGIFEGMADNSRVAGNQIRALGMRGKTDMGLLNLSSHGAAWEIRNLAGVSGVAGMAIHSAFTREIVPAAQRALLTFNTLDRSSATINNWAGAIAGAAIDGSIMGMTYEKSMGQVVKMGNVFGQSAEKTRRGFKDMMTAARLSALTIDEVEDSLGNMEEMGRKFGAGGMSSYLAISGRLAGTNIESGAQRRMLLQSFGGLMNDMPRLLGLASVRMGTTGAISGYVDAIRNGPVEGRGSRMAAFTGRAASGVAGHGGLPGFGDLQSPDQMKAWTAAMSLGQTLGVDPTALLDKKFAKEYEKFLKNPTDAQQLELDKKSAAFANDYTKQGMISMVQQQGVLESILRVVTNMGNIMGAYSGNGISIAKTLVTGVKTSDEEMQSTMEPMSFKEGR